MARGMERQRRAEQTQLYECPREFEKVPAQEHRRSKATCQFEVVMLQAVQTRASGQQEDGRQCVTDVAPKVGIRVAPALQNLLNRSRRLT
jgi:hypothetical protein